jgi:hypothetical protein
VSEDNGWAQVDKDSEAGEIEGMPWMDVMAHFIILSNSFKIYI